MTSAYPGALDPLKTDVKGATDTLASVPHDALHNNQAAAIKAVQATLGVNPQGTYATVGARLDSMLASIVSMLPVGTPMFGGFLGPIMDTSQSGAILANDQSQSPQRYRLIDMGVGYENAAVQWQPSDTAAPLATNTMWDGLAATQAMISAGAAYPAAMAAAAATPPNDAASPVYIPSAWELLAMYWIFKQSTTSNASIATTDSTFPGGSITQGLDPASDPQRPAFTSSVPTQTSLAAWQTGGAQAFQDAYYWTSTEHSAANAWTVRFDATNSGRLSGYGKSFSLPLRLVRRIAI